MEELLQIGLGLFGGLALFLYGMNLMSNNLQEAAGERMRAILAAVTKNPFFGVLAGALAGAAELANKLIGEDQTFADICFALKKFADSTHILFALASFDNLAKNGRVNRVVGFIAGRLNMRVLGRRTPDGKIDFFFKTRGETRVLAKILEQMDEDKYDGVHPVLISECGNQNAAQLLHHGIEAKWPGAPVKIVPCSGLCSFYAQDQGIIITY